MQGKKQPKNEAPFERNYQVHRYPLFVHVFRENHCAAEIIPRHWHRNIEISYRVKYSGELILNGKHTPLSDDQVILINSCDIHEIHRDPMDEMFVILVIFRYDLLLRIIPDIDHYYFEIESDNHYIKDLILDMCREQEEKGEIPYLKRMEYTYALLNELMEHCAHPRYSTMAPNQVTKWAMDLLTYTYDHLETIRGVHDLVEKYGYSREYFSRMFHQIFDVTCQEFLTQCRMETAMDYIERKEFSLEEVAGKVGYSSYRSFHDTFQKTYGISPRKYWNGLE